MSPGSPRTGRACRGSPPPEDGGCCGHAATTTGRRDGLAGGLPGTPVRGRERSEVGRVPGGHAGRPPSTVQLLGTGEGVSRVARGPDGGDTRCRYPWWRRDPAAQAVGFRAAHDPVRPLPIATLLVDLSKDEDRLLAGMKSRTRYNIRLAERRGVNVRRGGERDLATFYRLLTMTGQRQRFPVPPQEYFRDMLRIMVPRGHASLFIAEFAGEPLSAALLIAFGGMVSYKRGGWSGEQGNLHPNELLHWTAIRWAKREGYRYYDFEGVDLPAHVPGAHLDPAASRVRSVSAFKTGFGGDLVLLPQAYELVDNPVLRRGYDWVGGVLFRSTVRPAYVLARDGLTWLAERHHGIRTGGLVPLEELGLAAPDRVHYKPAPWRALPRRQVGPDDVFVDLGSGMG
jgi:hypothetical protein